MVILSRSGASSNFTFYPLQTFLTFHPAKSFPFRAPLLSDTFCGPLLIALRRTCFSPYTSLTKQQPVSVLWSGCQRTQGEIRRARRRLHPSSISWCLFESRAPVRVSKAFSSRFRGGASRLRREDIQNEGSGPMFSLSQCCTGGNSEVFWFWASSKGQWPNCLVMETTCRAHSIQWLKNISPASIKLNNYRFPCSPHLRRSVCIQLISGFPWVPCIAVTLTSSRFPSLHKAGGRHNTAVARRHQRRSSRSSKPNKR